MNENNPRQSTHAETTNNAQTHNDPETTTAPSTLNDSSSASQALIEATGRTQSARGKLARGAEKEAIIAAISQCAAQLGRVPNIRELEKICRLNERAIQRNFGNYANAFRACGLEPEAGQKVSTDKLFQDLAAVVRLLGKMPTIAEYELHGRYTEKPFSARFGTWRKVPKGLADFAEKNGLAGEWQKELELMKVTSPGKEALVGGLYKKEGGQEVRKGETAAPTSAPATADSRRRHRLLAGRPVYGASLLPVAPMHAPTNEQGVVYLFGALASRLGYVVLLIGQEFPDCVAFREVEPGMWQMVKIEFEFESRNFLRHGHDAKECDVVVCWKHNWAECPLEVVELRREIAGMAQESLPRIYADVRGSGKDWVNV